MIKSIYLQSFLSKFNELTKHPEYFLSCEQKQSDKIKTLLKKLYDYTNLQVDKCTTDILPELIINNLDEEQIWQQIEIKNEFIWPKFLQATSKLLSVSDDYLYINLVSGLDDLGNKTEASEEENSIDSDNSEQNFADENLPNDEEFGDTLNKNTNKIKIRPSIVDDKFFKLSELEAFLNSEDKKENLKHKKNNNENTNNDDIDYFNPVTSDDECKENNINYQDFFEHENCQKNSIENQVNMVIEQNEEEIYNNASDLEETKSDSIAYNTDSESNRNNNGNNSFNSNCSDTSIHDDVEKKNSTFEHREERLSQRIEEYEEKALGEKPWQLKGEVNATSRPQNSLLEDILEYDSSIRPPPVITEELNQSIEDIIRQRIKDKAWDDVVRTEKQVTTPQELKKKLILNAEKSKESLAQIYEKEYQKEIEKLSPTDETEKDNVFHREIKEMMSSLFNKLDALSNFHFTPKPIVPEPKIVTNIPVINMEEIAPVFISDAKLLAPEEVRGGSKGNVFGLTERTKTDKARERRHKKLGQKFIFKDSVAANPLKNQNGKKSSNNKTFKNDKLLKDAIKFRNISQVTASNSEANLLKNSKTFFSKLQDTKDMKRKVPKKNDKHELSAKKLKL